MKATGIVRRIDDLGRVVVPKEIRRTLRIRREIRWRFYGTERSHCIEKIFPHRRVEHLCRSVCGQHGGSGRQSGVCDGS